MKINKRCIQLDTNVFIDLILLPRKLHANSRLWLKTYSDLYCKSSTNNHRCNYYMENKMTSLKTYLCVLKLFDAKIYLWHLQVFLISGAKIKLHFNWRLTKIPWRNIWCIGVPWDGNACTKSGPLRFSQFSDCWLILSVCWLMSFAFPFGRLFGVR